MENFISSLKFRNLVPEEIEKVLDRLVFRKNQTVFMEGSTPLGVYILYKGSILIFKLGSQKEQVLRILQEGEMFGCTDLILQKRFGSSARAILDSIVFFMPKNLFMELLKSDSDFNQKIISQFANEIKKLEEKSVSLAFKPVRGRLADSLLFLNQKTENTDKKIYLSRKELAGYTGTVKETVNRLLSEFRKEKLISMNRKEINILNQDHLQKISTMYE
ncbi:hypothetical protein C7S20_10070 [Christiangramia fulva]|uniref:Crp/Fnr family transcriptional regulator n=1 Tax=Christiangramia fulva TaxID=2126553 RepID=A0A2R3Z5M8_9FLAO|nr:Crp/Fnr family transcriptional regulator [Christiangramia fulva]AVR45583.1 hypothetical protein C7S20_10070 [Christiangramia fulva]